MDNYDDTQRDFMYTDISQQKLRKCTRKTIQLYRHMSLPLLYGNVTTRKPLLDEVQLALLDIGIGV